VPSAATPPPKKLPRALLERLMKRGVIKREHPVLVAESTSNPSATDTTQTGAGWTVADLQQPVVQPQAASDLPPGWQEAVDLTYNHLYWFNTSTGERTWVKPSVQQPSPIPCTASTPAEASGGVGVMSAPPEVALELPAGWKEAVDPAIGVTYYFNRVLNKQQWTRPGAEGATAVAEEVQKPGAEGDGARFLSSETFTGAKGAAAPEATGDAGALWPSRAPVAMSLATSVKRKRLTPGEQQALRHHQAARGPGVDGLDPLDPSAYSNAPRCTSTGGLFSLSIFTVCTAKFSGA
jgi:hypothetical protein